MTLTSANDTITVEDLRDGGSLKWTKPGGEVMGAWVAEMDFGTAPSVRYALRAAVDADRFGYIPPAVADNLARACARWQQERYGWTVTPEQVHAVSDVVTALEVVMRHFTRPGGKIILPTPAYMPFLTVPPLHGRDVLQVPMTRDSAGRYALDLDGVDRAFLAGGDLLVLCNPANPVGRVLTEAELAGVTEVVTRHSGRVFADEIHAPLVHTGSRHIPYASTSTAAAAHTVTATSASKAWNLPGLKCGQVILTNRSDLEAWQRVGTGASTQASTLGAIASTAAYQEAGAWLDEVLAYLDRNRRTLANLVEERLPGVGYTPPEGTYLAWLDCRQLAIGDHPARFFQEQAAVALIEGSECGAAGQGYVRLNFATPLPILKEMISRMADAAAGSRPGARLPGKTTH